jgi:hypothetical protein
LHVRAAAFAGSLVLALVGWALPVSPAVPTAAAAGGPKVVLIVGATEATTATYIKYADAEAAVALKYTSNVVKVYSPNATWAAVKKAVQGASVVIYHGHGNGWPSPYTYQADYRTKDGFGLNDSTLSNNKHVYYGEPYLAGDDAFDAVGITTMAPNAIVLLGNLCYASGNSEPDGTEPTLTVAKQRADNYAAGFLRAGASAVIADGHMGLGYYLDALFTKHETVEQLWRAAPDFHNHVISYASARTTGANARLDPDVKTSTSTTGFYRSLVGDLATTTDDILNRTPTFVPVPNTTFTALAPVRLLDTRDGTGLSGTFANGKPRSVQIAGRGGVPADAVAVALNVTVPGAAAGGYVTLSPTADATPTTSTLNFPAGDVRANGAIVPLASDGTLSGVYAGGSGSIDLLIDVTGYYR